MSRYTGGFQWTDITNQGFYEVELQSIEVNGQGSSPISATTTTIVDSSAATVMLPEATYNDLQAQWQTLCATSDTLDSYLCGVDNLFDLAADSCRDVVGDDLGRLIHDLPSLSYTLQNADGGSFTVQVPPNHYLLFPESTEPGFDYCVSLGMTPVSTDWVTLGIPFMRPFYTVFDRENLRVGFATANNEGTCVVRDPNTPTAYSFATATTGTGNGNVTGSTANGTYSQGTNITLVATPDADSTFDGWAPASCVDGFSLEADTTCTATFTLKTYAITEFVDPPGSGTLTCTPNPVDYGANSTCAAVANVGFLFEQFSGDCSGAACTLTNVMAPKTVTAEFIIEDFDGVPALVENAAPNMGDGNGDGMLDAEQANVSSLPAADGNGYLTVETSGACAQLNDVQTSLPVQDGRMGYIFPRGILGFSLPCETATVTVYYHALNSLAGHEYRKYGPLPAGSANFSFYFLPGVVFGTTLIDGQTVATATFDLADNAPGDATGDDGVIVDPGGPALAPIAVPVMTPLGLGALMLLLALAGMSLGKHARDRLKQH